MKNLLTETEKCVWLTFKAVCLSFLGNVKTENYKELVEDLLNAHQSTGCNMSLKILFLHSHLDFFPPNLSAVSDEPRRDDMQESCHRTSADCCWNLTEQVATASCRRMGYRKFLSVSKFKHLFSYFCYVIS